MVEKTTVDTRARPVPRRTVLGIGIGALAGAALAGCAGSPAPAVTAEAPAPAPRATTPQATARPPAPTTPAAPAVAGLPGMPPIIDPHNVYSQAGANMLSGAVKDDRALVYVPHDVSGDVWVIDPRTFAVVAKHPAGEQVQHVVPSYDMRTLYAADDVGNHLLPIDARTGLPGRPIPAIAPYNLYFTPDGRFAIVVAEARAELIWYDPHSWKQRDVTALPDCAGIDHADFSADGRTAVFTAEFSGRVAVVDVASHRHVRTIAMPHRNTGMGPQDIKTAPDGSAYYIADSDEGGLWVLDGTATKVLRFIRTGKGAHGLYLSRDARQLYVTNRLEGSISVLDSYTGASVTKWKIPGGGSPDMGNVSADGSRLWLSGRYDDVVYVLSTTDGKLIRKIPVGREPHGLCVWPQPGRYSLGHTGITR
ncbi:SMP-30/gluconolactonase/LRE family protein [Arthrobacter sp.]|uniref:YncE family protein n=1 Tax=Arthrobacter sp. TaxID=1667 RepID=UPI00258D7A5F|nr:SMP-30/gluconolactonase/LRE family protein [Arthrobacter sp.]